MTDPPEPGGVSVIDPHVHVWEPAFLPAALRMSWAEYAAYRRDDGDGSPDEIFPRVSQNIVDPTGAHLTAAMDQAGVTRSIILGEALVETGKTAVFHTAYTRGRLAWRHGWPVHIADVAARHPDLTIVLAHAGFPCWWDECVALAASHGRTYLEVSLWQEEALVPHSTFLPMLERAIRLCGADRILFASDTMYGERLTGADEWGRWVRYFRDLPAATDGRISAGAVADMLQHNAQRAYFTKR